MRKTTREALEAMEIGDVLCDWHDGLPELPDDVIASGSTSWRAAGGSAFLSATLQRPYVNKTAVLVAATEKGAGQQELLFNVSYDDQLFITFTLVFSGASCTKSAAQREGNEAIDAVARSLWNRQRVRPIEKPSILDYISFRVGVLAAIRATYATCDAQHARHGLLQGEWLDLEASQTPDGLVKVSRTGGERIRAQRFTKFVTAVPLLPPVFVLDPADERRKEGA